MTRYDAMRLTVYDENISGLCYPLWSAEVPETTFAAQMRNVSAIGCVPRIECKLF